MLKTIFILLLTLTFLHGKLVLLHLDIPQKPNQSAIEQIKRLKNLAHKHGLELEFKGVPWKRGLLMIEKGLADGMFGCSYTPQRAQFAVYPMKDGKLDTTKKLTEGKTYYIYKNKNSKLSWDGEKFLANNEIVGLTEGYAVLSDLQKHKNIQIREIPSLNLVIRDLINGQLLAYAGLESEVQLFENNEEFQKNIIKEVNPIRKKPYFVIFSKIQYKQKEQEIEKFWNMLQEK